MDSYFKGCSNLELTATDALDLTGTTSLSSAFYNCTNLGSDGSLNNWDVSSVTSMYGMFFCASSFNQPLGDWDISSVTSMSGMFTNAFSFDQPLGDWDVSSVRFMSNIFSSRLPIYCYGFHPSHLFVVKAA